METDRPGALESSRLDNASGSSLSVVMDDDFDDEDEVRGHGAAVALAVTPTGSDGTEHVRNHTRQPETWIKQ